MNKITVTGNIVSRNGVTLFLTDGTSRVLAADSFRTQAVLDAVLPTLARSETIEIDLDDFSLSKVIEKASRGAIKIDETDGKLNITTAHSVVENAHDLRAYVEEAAQSGNTLGFRRFMAIFGEMAKTRKHSADELLTFMKGADLPIADDGSIIGYKVLRAKDNDLFDPHSETVRQNLGSLVFMPASKVNDDRRLLCSTGLHIAARNYLGGFWYHNNGRLCLVKINPDNVISVPQRDERSKMRVCAYHIVKVLSVADGEAIAEKGKNIEDLPEAAQMLADAVAGNHTPILQRVEVGVNGVVITKLKVSSKPRKVKPTRKRVGPAPRINIAKIKDTIAAATPYEKKLARAQSLYDKGDSIREIAKKLHMDRETLGNNLDREVGR